jgi:hypothetical protein
MTDEQNKAGLPSEPMVEIFSCTDVVESTVVQDALQEAGIPFMVNPSMDLDQLGILDGEHFEGVIAVLERDVDRAVQVIHEALPDETEVETVDEEEPGSA